HPRPTLRVRRRFDRTLVLRHIFRPFHQRHARLYTILIAIGELLLRGWPRVPFARFEDVGACTVALVEDDVFAFLVVGIISPLRLAAFRAPFRLQQTQAWRGDDLLRHREEPRRWLLRLQLGGWIEIAGPWHCQLENPPHSLAHQKIATQRRPGLRRRGKTAREQIWV